MKSLFEYRNYKTYLKDLLDTRYGERSKLSAGIGCQPAFLSQVLNGEAHLSQEQALLASVYLGHTQMEEDFFLTLLNYSRSGSKPLEAYYERKLEQLLQHRQDLSSRITTKKKMSEIEQMKFYSSWSYQALQIFLSLPNCSTREALAQRTKLPVSTVSEQLEFLVAIGLAVKDGDKYGIGTKRIHLSKNSPLVSKHHTNWRMKAIESFDLPRPNDFHYSLVMSLSEKDILKVRSLLIDTMEKIEMLLEDSPCETVYVLNSDLFLLL